MSANDEKTAMHFYPRIRKSPYVEATQRYGATAYKVYNHMYHPHLL